MVIYEVNVRIEKEIYKDFKNWLKDHANQMLQFAGFISFEIFQEKGDDLVFTTFYQVLNMEALDSYFANHAQKMRADGVKRFGTKISASRRILNSSF